MTALGSSLRQTQGQRLRLTPSLRQALSLLQLSSMELQLHVETELAQNPLLELENETFDMGAEVQHAPVEVEALPFDDPVGVQADFSRTPSALSWAQTAQHLESGEPNEYEGVAGQLSLGDALLEQLGCLPNVSCDKQLAMWLIGNLNDEGLFDEPLEDIIEDSPFTADRSAWQIALETLQGMEPAGIGAFSRTESLVLQLSRRASATPDLADTCELAARLLQQHASLLARHDVRALSKACECSDAQIQAAYEVIETLDPHPASDYAEPSHYGYIIPDILVLNTADGWKAELNPQIVPPLRFNQDYFDLLTKAKLSARENDEWKQKASQAKTLIYSLEHRFSTLLSVAQTIVQMQSAFFEQGPSAIVPMTLRGVADQLQIAESTVSRATADKYLQCPQGTFELKYFFTSALQSENGESAVSSMTARRRIKELVSQENPLKPLSDAALADALQKEGIVLARRTVAKYREMENIAPKSMRRRSV